MKKYNATMKITGRYETHVQAVSSRKAEDRAVQKYRDTDFTELEEIIDTGEPETVLEGSDSTATLNMLHIKENKYLVSFLVTGYAEWSIEAESYKQARKKAESIFINTDFGLKDVAEYTDTSTLDIVEQS
jgi:hypothetical protein